MTVDWTTNPDNRNPPRVDNVREKITRRRAKPDVSDRAIGAELGISPHAVQRERERRGIAPCPPGRKPPPGGNRTVYLSVRATPAEVAANRLPPDQETAMPEPITADTLTVDMVHEHFPGAFTDPVTVDEDLQLKCYRAVGCLTTEPALRQRAREYLAAAINRRTA